MTSSQERAREVFNKCAEIIHYEAIDHGCPMPFEECEAFIAQALREYAVEQLRGQVTWIRNYNPQRAKQWDFLRNQLIPKLDERIAELEGEKVDSAGESP